MPDMTTSQPETTTRRPFNRSRWAAFGAAVAVAAGAGGGFGLANAVQESGTRSTYTPISPCRLSDTRSTNQIGPRNTALGAGETYTVAARGIQGKCTATDLPTDATALVLNVTALGASSQTFLTFWPDGERPEAASLNPSVGAPPIPNAVTTALASDGSFKIYNERGAVNVVIDVAGYYTDHNHDDRYYTKQGTDAAIQAQEDNLLNVLTGTNGPVKLNTQSAQANKNHIERKQTVAVNPHAFHAKYTKNFRDVDTGAFVPSVATANELWAPVDIPIGAVITGVRARLIDNTAGAAVAVQLFQVAPNGSRQEIAAKITTLGASDSASAKEYSGIASFRNDATDVTYEVRAAGDQGVFWSNVGNDMQVVAFYVDYEMEVTPVT